MVVIFCIPGWCGCPRAKVETYLFTKPTYLVVPERWVNSFMENIGRKFGGWPGIFLAARGRFAAFAQLTVFRLAALPKLRGCSATVFFSFAFIAP
jgi:hypothetical protein